MKKPGFRNAEVGIWNYSTLYPQSYMKLQIVGTANRSLRRAQAEWNIEQEISNDEVLNRCAQSF
jgi:hypothetical protein